MFATILIVLVVGMLYAGLVKLSGMAESNVF